MTARWSCLPLLPLRCILDHLSTEDALAATSTCHHWRTALLMYSGHREQLRLKVTQLNKSLFLTRLFGRHVRRLRIDVDCTEKELDRFMTHLMSLYFETANLQEITFIGPTSASQQLDGDIKLNRIMIEGLILKHSRSLQKVAFIGCEMQSLKTENDLTDGSTPISPKTVSPADRILSTCNIPLLVYSAIKHIIVDYDVISTEALETLSQLQSLSHLSLIIAGGARQGDFEPVDWANVNECFRNKLSVGLNLMALPPSQMRLIIQNVLVEDLPLTSLKVMFCRTIYPPLVTHVAAVYDRTLRELVWADGPFAPASEKFRVVKHKKENMDVTAQANCFILLCWQCINLERLVIHGYWIWHYNVVGFLRLRGVRRLEVSALFGRAVSHRLEDHNVRVLAGDPERRASRAMEEEIKEHLLMEWSPIPWRSLPAGLRAGAPLALRQDYFYSEACRPLDDT